MSDARVTQSVSRRLLDLLYHTLSRDPGQALGLVIHLLESLGKIISSRASSSAAYEVLSHDCTIEFLDPAGEKAAVTCVEAKRFLQDNVIAFYDTCWGDGQLYADYTCSPGVPVDLFTDGNRQRVLVSLRETRRRGEILVFYRRCLITGGFTQLDEWWQTQIVHPTRWLRVKIVFPKNRQCQWATVTQENKGESQLLGASHFRMLNDGRQELCCEFLRPARRDGYTIRWRW